MFHFVVSVPQAAAILGIMPRTVRTLIKRARKGQRGLVCAPRKLWPYSRGVMLYLADVEWYRDTRRKPTFTPPRKVR